MQYILYETSTWFGYKECCVDGDSRELSLIDIPTLYCGSTNMELVGD